MLQFFFLPLSVLFLASNENGGAYLTEFRRGELALEEGRYGLATEAFDTCLILSPRNRICAFYQACVAAQSGSAEAALAWTERALDWGYEDLRMFEVEPDLKPLHGVAAFESMIESARQDKLEVAAANRAELAWSMGDFTALSSDGSRLIGKHAANVAVFDIDSEEFMYFLTTGDNPNSQAIFNPEGDLLITCSYDKTLACWDAWSGEIQRRFDEEASNQALSITNDDRYLLCGRKVWDVETGSVVLRLPSPQELGGASLIDPLGRFVLTVQRDSPASLWDLETGEELASQGNVGTPTYKLGFDTSGKYAWVTSRMEERKWLTVFDLDQTKALHNKPVEERHEPFLLPLREGVFASFVDGLHLVDPIRREIWRSLESSPHRWMEIAADPRGRSILENGGRRMWDSPIAARDLSTGREVWKLPASGDHSWRWAFTLYPDRFLIVKNSGLEIRASKDGECLHRARPFGLKTSEPLVLSASDRILMADSGGDLSLFDIRKGIRARRFSLKSNTRKRLAGTRESTRALISRPVSGLALVDVESGEVLQDWPDLLPGTGILAPDGERVLARAEDGYVIIGSDTGEVLETLGDPGARSAAWSPDGMSIAISANDTVSLWNAATGAALGQSLDHPESVWCLAFDASGDRLATGTRSGDVRIWNVDSGQLEKTFPHPGWFGGGRIAYLEFSPDGSLLACTGHAGTLWMWSIDEGKQVWKYDYGHGNPAPMYAHFDDDGERLYVSGQMPTSPRVFDVSTGETVADLSGDGVGSLKYLSPGRFVGYGFRGLSVYDEETCRILYVWVPFPEGESLMHTRQGYFSCSPGVERKVHLMGDPTSHPLESFAVALYDPKRVRAAVSGVHLRSPELGAPPRLALLNNQRFRMVSGESVRMVATAADPEGMGGFWIEVDGIPIPGDQLAEATEISEDGTSASLNLDWPLGKKVTFRLQAIGTTGLRSRPRWITAEPRQLSSD